MLDDHKSYLLLFNGITPSQTHTRALVDTMINTTVGLMTEEYEFLRSDVFGYIWSWLVPLLTVAHHQQ